MDPLSAKRMIEARLHELAEAGASSDAIHDIGAEVHRLMDMLAAGVSLQSRMMDAIEVSLRECPRQMMAEPFCELLQAGGRAKTWAPPAGGEG